MLYSEITGDIIGAAMEVHRKMGRGFQEYIYQRALEKELHDKKLSVKVEHELPVYYKSDQIGLRRVDFLVNDVVCVEIKAVSNLEEVHLAQALNYLEASDFKVGLLINFGAPSLQFKKLQKRDNKQTQLNPKQNPLNPGSIIAMIPARYAATRFPGKLMQMLGDKTVIRHTYDAAISSGLFDDVIVVTDSEIIQTEISTAGGHVVMSRNEHESGSDRIAEAADTINADIIVNVQGDEPFIAKEPLEKLINLFNDESVQAGSLMRKITEEEAADPNCVKVVTDKNDDALYFSRSTIPFNRSGDADYYLHVGVYAYRKEMLLAFTSWPATHLEQTEKLEQLRLLENGVKIRMAETDYQNIAIDTPKDLENALAYLQQKK